MKKIFLILLLMLFNNLSFAQTISPNLSNVTAADIAVGTTTITGGTTGRVLYDNAGTLGEYSISGTGNVCMTTSCSLTTPSLGAATATSINGLTLTTGTGTLTLGASKVFTASNTLTLTATDGSTLAIGTGGTLGSNAYTSTAYAPIASPTFTGTVTIPTPFTLGVVSVTSTGTQLNYLSAATGTTGTTSTNVVFSTSPTLVTPTLGVATVTSVNKVAITAPATSATLVIADGKTATHNASTTFAGTDGKTLTVSNTLTFTGTDSSSVAFGAGGTVAYTANNLSVFASTTSAQLAGVISDETGTGILVFGTAPSFTTSISVTSATSSTITQNSTDATQFSAYNMLESGVFKAGVNFVNSNFSDATRRLAMELYNGAAGPLSFWTGNTKRGQIESNGNLTLLALANSAQSNTVCYNTGTGAVTYNVATTCLASDPDLKDFVDYLNPIEGLKIVNDMKPWIYSWKSNFPGAISGEQLGFSAVECAKVDIRLAALNGNGKPIGCRYEQYTAALTAAIQQLVKRIEALERH